MRSSRSRDTKIAAFALVAIALAGCSILSPATGIRTAPAPAQACLAALLGGTLAEHPQSGLGVTSADGQATAVEWPFGYTARNDMGSLLLVDERGRVVAREGDEVSVGGGFGNQFWHACGPVTVSVPD
jgi:hypothetical protein